MVIVAPPSPLDPAIPAAARPGTAVMLLGWRLDIPPNRVMKNAVGMAVPPGELPG
jgi:hypothetical protein